MLLKKVLKFRGGKMTQEQCNTFRNNSYLNLALTLREFEDISKKKEGAVCIDMGLCRKFIKQIYKNIKYNYILYDRL